jgi:hypothetical protein
VAADVGPGKIAKLPLPKKVKDQPEQWFEVMVHREPFTGTLLPPARANVYQVRLNVTEKRSDGDKKLANPILRIIEGRPACISIGPLVALAAEAIPAPGLSWQVKINKLPDDHLRLEMRLERNDKKSDSPEDLQVQTHSLHVIKVIRPDEKVTIQCDGIGKESHPTKVQVVVTPVKED